jgi:hypothetical protein
MLGILARPKSLALAALGISLLSPGLAAATQDDIRLSLDREDRLLLGNPETGVQLMSAAMGGASVAIYPIGGDYHRWHGQLWGDVGILALGPAVVWHFGLSMQTVADFGNSIYFRLVRLYYDANTGLKIRAGPGVLSVGYRHRCSHGADRSVAGRILIRSGFDLDYSLSRDLGPLELRAKGAVQVTVVGQNPDSSFQPRAIVYATGGIRWPIVGRLALVGSAGIGLALIGEGSETVFGLGTAPGEIRAEALPAAALGIEYGRPGPAARLLLHYQRLLDTGNTDSAQQAHLLAVRIEFLWGAARRGGE